MIGWIGWRDGLTGRRTSAYHHKAEVADRWALFAFLTPTRTCEELSYLSYHGKDELKPLRMRVNLNGQCAEHFPINLDRGVGIAFYSHPIADLNTHGRIKADKSASERGQLPQPD